MSGPFHPYATALVPNRTDFECVYRAPALAAMQRMAAAEGVPLGPVQERWEGARWIMEVPPDLQPQPTP